MTKKMGRPHHSRRSQAHLDFIQQIAGIMARERKAAGWTQKAFAEAIGVTDAQYNRFERSRLPDTQKYDMSIFAFRKACKVLGKSADYMLGRKRRQQGKP